MRLGITRPADQLKDLLRIGKARGVEVVPLPLTEIQHVSFDLPAEFHMGGQDWLVFSSANGVEAFFSAVARKPIRVPHSSRIAVVGSKTRRAVEERGYKVAFVPDEPYGETLFREFIEKFGTRSGKVVYARGEQVNFDPAQEFAAAEIEYYPIICYKTVMQEINPAVVAQFTNEDMILFTAPSSTRAYAEQFGSPVARPLAIGRTTAAEMEKLGWREVSIMPEPDIEKVLELV